MQLLRYRHSSTPSWKLITLLSSLSVLILNTVGKRMRLKPGHDERLERDSHLLAFLLFIVRYFPQPFHFLILPAHATPPWAVTKGDRQGDHEGRPYISSTTSSRGRPSWSPKRPQPKPRMSLGFVIS